LVGSQYVSIHPDLAKADAKIASIKSYFESLTKDASKGASMELKDYFQFAEDKGISKDQALVYLRTLHKLGAVLFFEGNVELESKILLNPKMVASAIETALRVPELKTQTKASLEAQLESLKQNLTEMQAAYESIDAKASRGANFIMYSVLGGLLFQWLLFARFTWWDFSWDVMEPVTYFTMTAELSLTGYLYYLWQGSEFANVDMWTILYNWRFRSIARSRGFNIQTWNDINNGIIETQKQILHHGE
jgi:prefoldin subunit 5